MTKEKLTKLGWEVLNHPPYSPDLAPSDFYLFRSMSNKLNNEQLKFKSENEAKKFVDDFFKAKNAAFYDRGIRKLPSLWSKCIEAKGNYL